MLLARRNNNLHIGNIKTPYPQITTPFSVPFRTIRRTAPHHPSHVMAPLYLSVSFSFSLAPLMS